MKVEAYFMSWVYPAANDEDPRPRCEVNIKYDNNEWENIFTSYDAIDAVGKKRKMLQIILNHHTGRRISEKRVKKMLGIPGYSFLRLEPKDLDAMLSMTAQTSFKEALEMDRRNFLKTIAKGLAILPISKALLTRKEGGIIPISEIPPGFRGEGEFQVSPFCPDPKASYPLGKVVGGYELCYLAETKTREAKNGNT